MRTSFRKDQRGIAHLALVLIAVVVLGAVGFAAYRVMNQDQDSGSRISSEEAKKIEAECKQDIDDEEFCKFASSFLTPNSYIAVLETEGANGSSTTTLKADGDNSQMTTTSDGQVVADAITLGNTTYIKDITDDKWTKYTDEDYKVEDLKDDIKVDFSETNDEGEKVEYKQIAKEACGDLTCFKYQIVDPSAESGQEQFIWFDDDDYLIRKWLFTGGEGSTSATFSYEDVDIKEPSPIKEASTSTDGPSEEEIQALMEQYGQ